MSRRLAVADSTFTDDPVRFSDRMRARSRTLVVFPGGYETPECGG
jgi:hypothetical protein